MPPRPPQASLDKILVSTQEDISVNATQYPLAGVGAAGSRGRPNPPPFPTRVRSQGQVSHLPCSLLCISGSGCSAPLIHPKS